MADFLRSALNEPMEQPEPAQGKIQPPPNG